MTKEDVARFWTFVDVRGTNDCWLWIGAKGPDGRPHFRVDSRMVLGTRLSWLIHRGEDPGQLYVLHNCPGGDNPSCVNPEHLWLGTHADNLADAAVKGRKNIKLTNEQVIEIRRLHSLAVSRKELAAKFSVSTSLISQIVNRTTRQHI
jgi:hypothetical protein